MPRTRNPDIVKRNDRIYAEWLGGVSLTELGVRYTLARQVVGRIVASYHPEEEEDGDRSLYRGYMWRLYDEVQHIGDNPGWKMRPDGRPAEGPEGEVALDTQVQVQAKELQLKIIRELRLLDGRDRPVRKDINWTVDVAAQASAADIAARRRELLEAGAIPGEVVRELPPGGEKEQQRGGDEG